MDHFSITCTTCGRRLRVKDRRLVGQIVACPKCQAMVLIEPPADDPAAPLESSASPMPAKSSAAEPGVRSRSGAAGKHRLAMGDESVDSEALTQERIAPLDNAPLDHVAGDFAQVDFGAEPSAATESWLGGELPPASLPPLSRPPAFEGEADAAEDLAGAVPPIAFQSEAAARRRQIIAVGTIAGVSLLLAATIFGLVVRSWRNGKRQASQQASGVNNGDPAGADAVTAGTPQPDSAEPDLAEPDLTEPDLAEPDLTEPDDAEPDDAAAEPGSPVGGLPAGGEDPFQGPASPLGDGPLGDGPTLQGGAAVDDAAEGPIELPAGLQRFVPLLQLDEAAVTNAGNQAAAPPTMADLVIRRPELAVRETDYPEPAERVDVQKQLNVRVKQLQAVDQPLDRLLRVVGQLGGIPIEYELLALDLAGMSPRTAVTLEVGETTALSLLGQVVQRAGCRVALTDGIVSVLPDNQRLANAMQQAFTIDDLQSDPLQMAADMKLLLGPTAAAAKVSVESGVLQVEGPPQVRARAALLLAAWRRARGLDLPLGAGAVDRWIAVYDESLGPQNRFADWQPLPETPTGLNLDNPYSIEMILGALAHESGAALVVDWQAAWSHGLTPGATALPWTRGTKAFQVAQQVLAPYVLTALDAGQGVWWLGTEEVYEAMPIVGVFSSQQAVDETRAKIAAAAGMVATEVPAVHDSQSGKWIVFLPRYILRELPALVKSESP
ncbi:hypothetical protein SH139x_000245 [Planctomycetaceae bacterium SH139]